MVRLTHLEVVRGALWWAHGLAKALELGRAQSDSPRAIDSLCSSSRSWRPSFNPRLGRMGLSFGELGRRRVWHSTGGERRWRTGGGERERERA